MEQTSPDVVGPNQSVDWLALGLGVRRVEQGPDGVLLPLIGEVDLASAEPLARRLRRELARAPTRLEIDLSAVTFCSVRGAHVLAQVGDDALAARVEFLISGASPKLRSLMSMCDLGASITWLEPSTDPHLTNDATSDAPPLVQSPSVQPVANDQGWCQ